MRRTVVLAVAAALPLAARAPHAQIIPDVPDVTDLAPASKYLAYFAITSTPLGALPPAVGAQLAGADRQRGIGFRAQFGQVTDQGLGGLNAGSFDITRRVIAAGIDIPLGRGTLGLTGGYLDFGCDEINGEFDLDGDGVNDFGLRLGCKSGLTGGASWSMPLIRHAPASAARTGVLVGLDADVGASSGDLLEARITDASAGSPLSLTVKLSTSALAAGLGIPVGLVVRSGGLTVVPHVVPRVAWGRTKIEVPSLGGLGADAGLSAAEDDVRFMLGGGLSLLSDSGLGIEVGVQKVFVDQGKTTIGAGVSWTRR